MTLRSPLFPALLGLSLALPNLPQAALAQQTTNPRASLTPEQKAQIFPQQKELWLKHARARIASMQANERCVQASTTFEAFQGCQRQERQANLQMRLNSWAELRALYARYGVQLPETRPERGTWRKPGTTGTGGTSL